MNRENVLPFKKTILYVLQSGSDEKTFCEIFLIQFSPEKNCVYVKTKNERVKIVCSDDLGHCLFHAKIANINLLNRNHQLIYKSDMIKW